MSMMIGVQSMKVGVYVIREGSINLSSGGPEGKMKYIICELMIPGSILITAPSHGSLIHKKNMNSL